MTISKEDKKPFNDFLSNRAQSMTDHIREAIVTIESNEFDSVTLELLSEKTHNDQIVHDCGGYAVAFAGMRKLQVINDGTICAVEFKEIAESIMANLNGNVHACLSQFTTEQNNKAKVWAKRNR